MITWNKYGLGYRIYILGSACFSLLMLAKNCTDHHFFESSAKNVTARPPYSLMLKRLLFYLLHIIIRGFVISLLASYLHLVSIAFIILMVVMNYILANLIIKTDGSKHFWTAAAAVVVPTCFVARDSLEGKQQAQSTKVFTRFYKWNTVLFFFIFGVAALITTNCLLLFTDVNKYTCDNLPFLSYDFDNKCPGDNPFPDLTTTLESRLPAPHTWFYLFGNLLVLLLSALHLVLMSVEERCCTGQYQSVNPL